VKTLLARHFGFWILDFGLTPGEETIPDHLRLNSSDRTCMFLPLSGPGLRFPTGIQNPKSKIQDLNWVSLDITPGGSEARAA